jgi:uncharacterized protein (TIGR02099 family)
MFSFSVVWHKTLYFVAVFLLVIACFLSLARSLTPFLTTHKAWLSELASTAVGLPVEVGSVEASVVGVTPGISLSDLVIFSADRKTPILKIAHLKVGISVVASLWHQKWITSSIYIDGVTILLEQNGKAFRMNGYTFDPSVDHPFFQEGWLAPDTAQMLNILLMQHHIHLDHIAFTFYRDHHKMIDLHRITLSLWNKSNQYRLRGTVKKGDGDKVVRLEVDLKGAIHRRELLSGQAYLKIDNPFLLSFYHSFGSVNFNQLNGHTEVWADFEKGMLQAVRTKLAVSDLDLTVSSKPIKVASLNGMLFWKNRGQNSWSLSSHMLAYQLGAQLFPVADFALFVDETHASQSLTWQHFNWQMMKSWAAVNWLPRPVINFLASSRPEGELKNIKILHEGSWQALTEEKKNSDLLATLLPSLYVGGDFSDFSFNDPKLHLTVNHLEGGLLVRPTGGELKLTTQNGGFNAPTLFLQPFTAIQAAGILQWEKNKDQRWQIKTDRFILKNELAAFETSMRLILPDKEGGASIDVVSHFEQSDAAELKNLVPRKGLDKALVTWLDQAFLAGDSEQGTLLWRGQFRDFPYENGQGQFAIEANIQNMDLHYADGWPDLMDLNGLFRLEARKLSFDLQSGSVLNKPLQETEAFIPKILFKKVPTVLHVKSKVALEVPEALAFIKTSPLKQTLSGLSKIQGTGPVQLDLGLTIPLQEDNFDNIKVDGKIDFANTDINLSDWQLAIKQVKGLFYFSEKAVWAKELQANLFNEPAKIQIKTIPLPAGNDTAIRFIVDSTIDVPELEKQFNLPILKSMRGKTNYQGIVDLPMKGNTESLTVTTNLQGVNIDLPAPYGKSAGKKQPFNLKVIFPSDGTHLFFDYADLLQAHLWFTAVDKKDDGLKKAIFHVGAKEVAAEALTLPKEEGVWVVGKVPEFNWTLWQPMLEKYFPKNKTNLPKPAQTPFLINVSVGKMTVFDQVIDEANVKVQPVGKLGDLQIDIDSTRMLGQLKVPFSFPKDALVANFSRFYLPAFKTKENTEKVASTSKSSLKPMDVPPLRFIATDFQIGNDKLGKMTVNFLPDVLDQSLKMEMTVASSLLNGEVVGNWKVKNKIHYTSVKVLTKISNVGSLLKNFNLTERLVGARGNINFDIHWPAAPWDFNFKNVSGDASINLVAGTIVGFDESTQTKLDLGKLLNAFSLQSVFQRVSSGFSDVRHGGYGFSNWEGHYAFSSGQVESKDTLLAGSVGKIYLTGIIDTQKKNYDLMIKVVPQYTGSAPALAGFLGGPVIGVAAMAVNEVVSLGLDQVTVQNYTITGPWTEPQVTKLDPVKVLK